MVRAEVPVPATTVPLLAPTMSTGLVYSRVSHGHCAHSACGQGEGRPRACNRCPAAFAHLAIGDRRNATDGQGGRHLPRDDASHPLTEHRVSVRVHAGDQSCFLSIAIMALLLTDADAKLCRPNPFPGSAYGSGYTWSGPMR